MDAGRGINRPFTRSLKPGPVSKACMNCAMVKCKCIHGEGDGGCERQVMLIPVSSPSPARLVALQCCQSATEKSNGVDSDPNELGVYG